MTCLASARVQEHLLFICFHRSVKHLLAHCHVLEANLFPLLVTANVECLAVDVICAQLLHPLGDDLAKGAVQRPVGTLVLGGTVGHQPAASARLQPTLFAVEPLADEAGVCEEDGPRGEHRVCVLLQERGILATLVVGHETRTIVLRRTGDDMLRRAGLAVGIRGRVGAVVLCCRRDNRRSSVKGR